VHLLAVHLDTARRLDAQAHDITPDVEHGEDDVVADHHALTGTTGQDEHAPLSPPLGDKGRIADITQPGAARAPAGRCHPGRAAPRAGSPATARSAPSGSRWPRSARPRC